MSAPIRLGDREFAARAETYAALLARAGLDEELGDATDALNGLAVEYEHAQQQMLALADGEGEFDAGALHAVRERRRDIRARMAESRVELFRARLALIAERLDPVPEVDWLMATLTEEGLDELTEALNSRPTGRPASASAGS